MKRATPFFAAIAAIVLVLAVGIFAGRTQNSSRAWGIGNPSPAVMIGGERVSVQLATTEAQREQGLSGTQPLAADHGMLFVFPQDGQYHFWMKDMNYALDIIWIDGDGRIVSIAPSLSPDTYPQSFGPNAPARYVLEVSAGFAAAHGVKVGDIVGL
ncbi:MAG TPA: DUF192 domain-containing protein [Candidatus Paceibacterota bacterium]|jgi:uncharacterized membrane protein (UPF0127 family)|nr:DUF192 domain-containing protein [Candidatus Paceibacterota bacterium]